MSDNVESAQKEAVLNLLIEVIAIFRDNKSFDPNNSVFGKIHNTRQSPGNPGMSYLFKNSALPPAEIVFSTTADPLDYSDERMTIPVVPRYFEILFADPILAINRSLIEKQLDLSGYWIDRDGVTQKSNDLGPGYAPQDRIHIYRYRANEHLNTRVPVDVELDYIDPERSDPSGVQELSRIVISHAYKNMTPEERKQKREEKEQRTRDLYRNPGVAQ